MALRLAVLLALNQLMALVNGETAILNLGGVFSFINKKDTHDVAGSQQFAAFRMAINEINDKNDGIFDDLLPDVQVKLAVRDGKDDFAQSVLHALDFTKKIMRPVGTHVVFSIADDNVTKGLASVLSGADVTQFTTTSTAELSKADRYPTMLRLIPSDAYQVVLPAHIYTAFRTLSLSPLPPTYLLCCCFSAWPRARRSPRS